MMRSFASGVVLSVSSRIRPAPSIGHGAAWWRLAARMRPPAHVGTQAGWRDLVGRAVGPDGSRILLMPDR
jgi:hypothetical protein